MAVESLSEAVPKRYAMGAGRIPTATAIAKRSIGTSRSEAIERNVWTYSACVNCSVLSGSEKTGRLGRVNNDKKNTACAATNVLAHARHID